MNLNPKRKQNCAPLGASQPRPSNSVDVRFPMGGLGIGVGVQGLGFKSLRVSLDLGGGASGFSDWGLELKGLFAGFIPKP